MSVVQPDPKLDLVLERVVDVPRELVWRAWTEPRHLECWFTPAPGALRISGSICGRAGSSAS
jgi:uncharacterized protein YndB with AHSA1/START domain